MANYSTLASGKFLAKMTKIEKIDFEMSIFLKILLMNMIWYLDLVICNGAMLRNKFQTLPNMEYYILVMPNLVNNSFMPSCTYFGPGG